MGFVEGLVSGVTCSERGIWSGWYFRESEFMLDPRFGLGPVAATRAEFRMLVFKLARMIFGLCDARHAL